ncbi:MAG: acyltransferase [Oscillochloridaceae bacterium]|nr:acyltransferase [Chloroflexaceae bacterium]MDW8389838.1 acyltransferase [Oscillochloridaceae bacterium]
MSFRTFIFALLFVLPPALKPWVLRVCCGARIGRNVQIGWFASVMGRHISLGDHCAIRALTLIRCDGDVVIGPYTLVSSFTLVYGARGLRLGAHSYVGPQCLINTEEEVRIGNWSALGARCVVYTHGSFLPYTEGYWVRFGRVTVGDYVWCAAGVFFQPGAEVGDNSFVNSRTVVSGALPPGSVAEGSPARVVSSMERMRRTLNPRQRDAAVTQMLRHFGELILADGMGLAPREEPGALRFTHHRRAYRIAIAPAQGPLPAPSAPSERTIWLVNRPDWRPPAPDLWLDLDRKQMTGARDHIYVELMLFLKRYYGVQLEYAERC